MESIEEQELIPIQLFPFGMSPLSVLGRTDLSHRAKTIFSLLLMHRNRTTHQCNPTPEILAREMGEPGKPKRAIEAISELCAAKLLKRKRQRYGASHYMFRMADEEVTVEEEESTNPDNRNSEKEDELRIPAGRNENSGIPESSYNVEKTKRKEQTEEPPPQPPSLVVGDQKDKEFEEKDEPTADAVSFPLAEALGHSLELKFPKPPPQSMRDEIKTVYTYDSSTNSWTADDTPKARALFEKYKHLMRPADRWDGHDVTPQAERTPDVELESPAPMPVPELPQSDPDLEPIRAKMQAQVTSKVAEIWFGEKAVSFTREHSGIVVWTSSEFQAQWLGERYAEMLEATAGEPVEIRVVGAVEVMA